MKFKYNIFKFYFESESFAFNVLWVWQWYGEVHALAVSGNLSVIGQFSLGDKNACHPAMAAVEAGHAVVTVSLIPGTLQVAASR